MPTDIVFTSSQQKAFDKLIRFVNRTDTAEGALIVGYSDPERIFILKGYAGTGKTTLIRSLVDYLDEHHFTYRLLASTGRAAKVLSNIVGAEATTVHSCIYVFKDFNQDLDEMEKTRAGSDTDSSGQLFLNFSIKEPNEPNEGPDFYIVDESSMISDVEDKQVTQAKFGSGRLLRDLLNYDKYSRFIFVGDPCQLPPVTQSESPALMPSSFAEYGATPWESELTEVVRQAENNDIALAAKKVRECYYHPQPWKAAKFSLRNYQHIHVLSSQAELLNRYIQDIRNKGYNHSTTITLSNKQCNLLTNVIRPSLGITSSRISKGDLLLVTQNNLISGLMNGDLVVVEEVGISERRAGLTFLKTKVKELFTGRTFSQFLIAEIVYQNATNLSQPQQKELFIDFYYRMKDIGLKQGTPRFNEAMLSDPYLNALRAVYGYALTCHKSQGGEWDNVYLDIPRNLPYIEKPYVYQWVYTAMTRARQELFVVDDYWVM